MKQQLDHAVHYAKFQIIKGDISTAIRALTENIARAAEVFGDSALELLPANITKAEAFVCKGGSGLKKGEKLLIV